MSKKRKPKARQTARPAIYRKGGKLAGVTPGSRADIPKGYSPGDYEKPSVTADIVVLTPLDGRLSILLIKRKRQPYRDHWAMPGGFVDMDEDLDQGAARELEEETGVRGLPLLQVGAFGHPDRDPRTRVITVAYASLVPPGKLQGKNAPRAADDAAGVGWFPVDTLPPLAFDHAMIIKRSLEHVRRRALCSDLLRGLLPRRFPFQTFRKTLETVLGGPPPAPRGLSQRLVRDGVLERIADTSPAQYRFARK